MSMSQLQKKITATIIAGACALSLGGGTAPSTAEAAGIGGVLGSVIGGAAAYKQVEDTINYYNNTEAGRQALLEAYKEKYKVSDNYYRKQQLDSIMARLTEGIGALDPSIYQKPYLYFINKEKTFNAFCSMGHVMSVNEGLYTMMDNEEEIAVVLAHEMGHGQKDHVPKSMRKRMMVAVGAGALASAMGTGRLMDLALDIAVNQIDKVVITKSNEWEADNLAFDYMLSAGYNPGATAAVWQRVEDKYGISKANFAGEIFNPSDHPTHKQRKENYAKRLHELSKKHAAASDGTVKVNGKVFVKPVNAGGMTGAERSYFVLGNLAAAYQNGHHNNAAYVSGNTVMLGAQPIMTCYSGDPSASELAGLLNSIK